MSETPKPTLQNLQLLPLPSSNPKNPTPPSHFIHIINDLLSATECNQIISTHQNLIPSNVTPSTKRDRELFEDQALADLLWSRLQPFYSQDRIQDEDGQWWKASSLNSLLRLCKYGLGGKFAPHMDGRRLASVNEQSFMTVNMYLNTVPLEHGGATRSLSAPMPNAPFSGEVLGKVQPVRGIAAVFRDCLWHDGEELLEGEKYLLRTDVMYEREVPFDFESIYGGLGDEAKGRKALAIAEGLEDAGSSGEAVMWYKKAFRLAPGLERGGS